MKITKLIGAAFLSLAALAFSPRAAEAVTTTYTDGDLFLGFRAVGATKDFLVNIGQPGSLTGGTVADVGTQLSTTFGANWYSRTDLFFGVIGGNNLGGTDPESTLYATRSNSVVWPQRSDGIQSSAATLIGALGNAFADSPSTGSSNALLQNVASNNSYASFQPGGTQQNSNTISFGTFGPSNEGTPKTVLYLNRITPTGSASLASRKGTIVLTSAGLVTYTPSPTNGTTVQFEQPLASTSEANGHASLTIIRDGDTSTAFTVNVSTTDGTASSGTGGDFTALTNFPVSFAAGDTSATVSVTVNNDAIFTGNRTFTAMLSGPTNSVTLGSPSSASVTILEDDPVPSGQIDFTQTAVTTNHLDASGNPAVVMLTLTRTNGVSGAVSVDVTPSGSLSGVAYSVPSQVNFADGQANATLEVDLNAIANPSGTLPGTIVLTIENPTNQTDVTKPPTIGASNQATITVNAINTVSFTQASYAISELASGDTQLTVMVTRSTSTGTASIDVVGVDGSATAAADYTLPVSPTVSFQNGDTTKSVVITIKAATAGETNETFQLQLQNGVNIAPATPKLVTVTILAPDATGPTLTLTSPKANATVTGASVTVTGNAKDQGGIGRIEVRAGVGGTLLATFTPSSATSDYSFSGPVVPEQGTSVLEVKAFDQTGNVSAAVTRTIKFSNLRPLLTGAYNGLIVADAAAAGIDFSGLINVNVTKTGSFTGKATIHGVKISLAGTVLTGNGIAFGPTKTATLDLKATIGGVKNTVFGKLALTLDAATKKIIGTVKDSAGTTTVATIVHADQALYNPTTNALPGSIYDAAKEKGHYTALFLADAAPNGGLAKDKFPQGDGYGTMTVSTKGVVKIVGKLADGSAVSYSNSLSQANTWPVFLSLYSSKGLLTGDVTFVETANVSDANASNMKWFKPDGLAKQAVYPAGWPSGITVDFAASKYIAPATQKAGKPAVPNPNTVLGPLVPKAANNTTANLVVMLDDGGLPVAGTTDDASLYTASAVKVLTTGATPAPSLKLAFTASTGVMTGSFKHPLSNATVKLYGAAFQKTKSASGYFLFTNPPAGSVAGSGAVTVTSH